MQPNHLARASGASRFVLAALVLGLATACTTTSSAVKTTKPAPGPWLEPSPALRERIADATKRLPWTHGLDRVEIIQWFAGVGEPAYPTLLAMVQDPRKDVAGAALAALGATRDSRLVEHLRAIPLPPGPEDADFELERARTLLRLGDWQMAPALIRGLRDERLVTRALCAQALNEATHERFDYDARAEPEKREQAVQRWESWWRRREQDPLLQAKK